MLNQITNFKHSDEYRSRIHSLIPGGAHTYSKGDDQFPVLSPAAIARGKGAYVWDVDNNKYLDCSMGLTSVSLGHAYEPVLDAIRVELENGVNFQRPAKIEMEMAEIFLGLVPSHQMIKFAKNGSTVTSAAVKLARAYTGRKLVAFPSDHPFYSYDDWFIGRTACNKGVPSEFSELTATFLSTDLRTLQELFEKYPQQIACVISEPEKSHINDPSYCKRLSELCKKNGALFIMDEMITGFKTAFPGSIHKFSGCADLATWGKGIANGFSFCALTGKKEIMELGGIRQKGEEKVFLISSTHGGETISMAAAIATVEEFKKKRVLEHNHEIGRFFSEKASEVILKKHLAGLVDIVKSEWLPLFTFKDKNGSVCPGMRTLTMQEMIKRGVLFQGIFVPCFSHNRTDVEFFMAALEETLDVYSAALEKGFASFLVGEPAKPVFRRFL
ncbi:MAG: glutamate-1-semialdehyde 2,1-aminomutase [Deltaproteobacteria bacterium]|nr:glutamate-1-semialdehyde 2,1-aminomutase [Deltaproteobacteria bacterium]